MGKTIKIHYIWLKNYSCFLDQEFNFSTQYKFHYVPQTGEITVGEKNNEYIDNFFGDNIDLTAVVGKNGTGKTTLLRFIQGLRSGDFIDTECVIVCENNGEFCAAKYYEKNNQTACRPLHIKNCENVDNSIVRKNIEQSHNEQRFFGGNEIRFIYLTEMFNMVQYTSSLAGCDDLSFASILYKQTVDGDEEKHVSNPVLRYIHRITDWQIDFLSNGYEYVKQFNINFPSCVTVTPSYDPNAFTDLYMKINGGDKKTDDSLRDNELNRRASKYLREFLNRGKSAESFSLDDEYAQAIFMNIITSINYVAGTNRDEEKILFTMIDQVHNHSRSESAWEIVYELLLKIRDNNRDYGNLLNDRLRSEGINFDYIPVEADGYIEFMDYLRGFLSDENLIDKRPCYFPEIKISTENKLEKVSAFFNSYKKCVRIVDFASFSFRLSSGETLLLNQFGKLTRLLKKDRKGKYYLPEGVNSNTLAQNAVILLDEAEVAFHPEWQRIYFDAFLEFVKKNISEQGTHVQIVLATHSPIILSDIPKQNAVFLTKDENNKITVFNDNEETFAANIFSLYQNAFFLDESGIGVFAERKLCDLIKKIHKLSEEQVPTQSSKDEIIREIKCIGDPYIRHKFEMEYEKMIELLPASKLDAEIKETEKRLTELKKQRRDLEDKYAEN